MGEKSLKDEIKDPLSIHSSIEQEAEKAKKKKSNVIPKRRHQKIFYKHHESGKY